MEILSFILIAVIAIVLGALTGIAFFLGLVAVIAPIVWVCDYVKTTLMPHCKGVCKIVVGTISHTFTIAKFTFVGALVALMLFIIGASVIVALPFDIPGVPKSSLEWVNPPKAP